MPSVPQVKLPLRQEAESDPEEGKSGLTVRGILMAKRDGQELNQRQTEFIIRVITDRTMEDAQLGALLMSIYQKGMTKRETGHLTNAMKHSGSVLEWPSSWTVVDKHSTGGVGDKVSLALAPALASLGFKVPMISGKGLGHTGGTLDKLESIPGFRVSLTEAEMISALESAGCCIVGQTEALVPADKRMYSVRDVTATVSSIPLIVSSIISKKACESLDSLVLDVKFGSGSFMQSQFEAESLAEALVSAGDSVGMQTSALVTSMEHPVGRTVGNALEVEEALLCLRGEGPPDLRELVVNLGAELIMNTGRSASLEESKAKVAKTLDDGRAMKTFEKMMEAQGVSNEVSHKLCGPVPDTSILPHSKLTTKIFAKNSGTIEKINAMSIAEVSLEVGAGRKTTSDSINYGVGVVLLKAVGDRIEQEEPWAEIRHDLPLDQSLLEKANASLTVTGSQPEKRSQSLIVRRICFRSKP